MIPRIRKAAHKLIGLPHKVGKLRLKKPPGPKSKIFNLLMVLPAWSHPPLLPIYDRILSHTKELGHILY